MARLIHLNGPPGIGKSTIARRYAAGHPGVLNCDIDVLRTMIGGWESDFVAAGALIRPSALAMISAYLANDRDVVLPQMLVRLEELRRFEAAAVSAGAGFVELMLMDTREAAVSRFYRRGDGESDEWHEQVRAIVETNGGDTVLAGYHDGLTALCARRPATVVVTSVERDIDQTYRAVLGALRPPT